MNAMERKVKDILSMPYKRSIIPDTDGGFIGKIDEFPGCLTQGETFAETWAMLQEAAELWLETMIEGGQEIPAPYAERKEGDFSGKFVVRIPKSLHRNLAMAAEVDGVSLNTLIVSLLSAEFTAHEGAKSSVKMEAKGPEKHTRRRRWTVDETPLVEERQFALNNVVSLDDVRRTKPMMSEIPANPLPEVA